jgi:predicted component of viral defense system (DUF524 family)
LTKVASLRIPCWSDDGEWLGELEIADGRGEPTLVRDDAISAISIAELAEYAVLLHGASPLVEAFAAPVINGRVGTANDLYGTLGRRAGLGALRLGLTGPSGAPLWQRTLRIRPEKFRDALEFETMVADLCAWRTALALDVHAFSSAPWSLGTGATDVQLEERLVVLRAAAERHCLLANLRYVERNSLSRLERDDSVVRLGEGNVDPHRLGMQLNVYGRRTAVPAGHSLSARLSSMPSALPSSRRIDSVDTPANQFAKFVASGFRNQLAEILREGFGGSTPIALWADRTKGALDRIIAGRFFSRVGTLACVDLGNPALQRRKGYREILQAYVTARAGLSIAWPELSEVVFGETRDVPQLYEIWCLLKLREAIASEFGVTFAQDHLQMKGGRVDVRRGSFAVAVGPLDLDGRSFSLRLWYNRTFSPTASTASGPFSVFAAGVGTWSKPMKPDFTIEISPLVAENSAAPPASRFVHLDAKYKLKKLPTQFDIEHDDRTHAADDIDKMHAYLGGINESLAAHVLYPGDAISYFKRDGAPFAVGAVALAPGRTDGLGTAIRDILSTAALGIP